MAHKNFKKNLKMFRKKFSLIIVVNFSNFELQKGSHDDFVIDPDSGKVSLLRELDYDRKNRYTLEVVAVDGGVPRALSGTATLNIEVLNKNDKTPHFSPATQRAHVTEDTEPGAQILTLVASDPDATSGKQMLLV